MNLYASIENIEYHSNLINIYCKLLRQFRESTNINEYIDDLEYLETMIVKNVKILNKYIHPVTTPLPCEIIDLCDDSNECDSSKWTAKKYKEEHILNMFITMYRECPICYNKFATPSLVFLQCSHFFCIDCFGKIRKSCPMCRMSLYPAIKYNMRGNNLIYTVLKYTK